MVVSRDPKAVCHYGKKLETLKRRLFFNVSNFFLSCAVNTTHPAVSLLTEPPQALLGLQSHCICYNPIAWGAAIPKGTRQEIDKVKTAFFLG